jgi:hypothetical protein
LDLEIKHAIAGRGLSSGTLGRHEEALQVFEKNLTRPTSDAALRNKEVMSDAPLSCLQILKAFFLYYPLKLRQFPPHQYPRHSETGYAAEAAACRL